MVYLDMTDPNTNCPSGWRFVTRDSKRLCGRVSTDGLSCDSVLFPVTGTLEETILVCVAQSEPTSMNNFSPTMKAEQPQLPVPMFLVSVSQMVSCSLN